MDHISLPDHTQYSKQHLKKLSISHKKWELEKVHIINHIDYILMKVIDYQFIFKVCISAKSVNVWAISYIDHKLDSQLDSASQGPDRPAEDQSLKPFRLSVHLHHHHFLTLQIHYKKRLSRCIIINKNHIITDHTD